MPRTAFKRVLDQVKLLTPEEQKQLREALDRLLSGTSSTPTEEEFERELYESGFLERILLPPAEFQVFDDERPIDIQGKPLSETIVEERR